MPGRSYDRKGKVSGAVTVNYSMSFDNDELDKLIQQEQETARALEEEKLAKERKIEGNALDILCISLK
jgi:hypothetical protein